MIRGDELGGSDDAEEESSTLASLKSAELLKNSSMGSIISSTENFRKTGNFVQNMMKDNDRITGDMLEITEREAIDETKSVEANLKLAQNKKSAAEKELHRQTVLAA